MFNFYLDDSIIAASNVNENVERLKIILQTMGQCRLEVNFEKCYFL